MKKLTMILTAATMLVAGLTPTQEAATTHSADITCIDAFLPSIAVTDLRNANDPHEAILKSRDVKRITKGKSKWKKGRKKLRKQRVKLKKKLRKKRSRDRVIHVE